MSLPVPPPPAPASGSLFLRWLDSASGKGCVWEWRWLVPSPSVLAARVRREGCAVRALSATHLLAIQNLGVPILVNGTPTWGPSSPSWDEVRAALSLTCGCPSSVLPDPPLSICNLCRRARVAAPCSPEDVLPCVWCRRSHGLACRLCCRAVHFRGECAWNRGANDCYRLSPHEGVLLCPDCLWSWHSMLVSCPARPCCVRPSGELARHFESVISQVQPGAGSHVARPKGPVSWSALRKWLLKFLDRHASCPQADVLVQCQDLFPSAPPPLLQHALSQVIRILCRDSGSFSPSVIASRSFPSLLFLLPFVPVSLLFFFSFLSSFCLFLSSFSLPLRSCCPVLLLCSLLLRFPLAHSLAGAVPPLSGLSFLYVPC